jgi:internalin A
MSNCALTKLPGELFALPLLRYLSVAHNCLTGLPRGITASKLILLNLSSNPLHDFPEELPLVLEQLLMAYCGLEQLPDTLDQNIDLVELNLSGNKLTEIPSLPNLLFLNLSDNQLTSFPGVSGSLCHLDLSLNQIVSIPKHLHLPNLEYFDISGNPIQHLPYRLRLPRLHTIKASGCPIHGKLDFSRCLSLWLGDFSRKFPNH